MLRISMHYPRCSVSLRFFSGHFSGLTAWVQRNSDKFHVITSKMSIVAYGIHTSVSILRLNYDYNLLPNKLAPWNKKRKKSMLLTSEQKASAWQAIKKFLHAKPLRSSLVLVQQSLPNGCQHLNSQICMGNLSLTCIQNSYFRAASYLKPFSRKSWMVVDLAKVMMVTFGKPLTSLFFAWPSLSKCTAKYQGLGWQRDVVHHLSV